MSTPISPPTVTRSGVHDLPAYVSNGLVGMRVLDVPLFSSAVLVNGYAGSHPQLQIDAVAQVPDPLAGDLAINDVWLRTMPQQAEFVEQTYDFSVGELHTRFRYFAEGATATIDVLTFCSRVEPSIVLQEISIGVSAECELALRSMVDVAGVFGSMYRRNIGLPGGMEGGPDASLSWESLAARSRCGIAYTTQLIGDDEAQRHVIDWGADSSLCTEYRIQARPGTTYRLRQFASLLPSILHQEPEQQAIRLVGKATADGFDTLREANQKAWYELWRGRVVLDVDDDKWQAMADAAFYYLNSSVHLAAPSSTSMYGLATWHDYHYYYGHVMWDIDVFCVPPLTVTQPDAARALVDFRKRTLSTAMSNAKLYGREGVQFPWESGPINGEEVAPGEGKASWYEDHVSLDVAWAAWRFANVTGDERFLHESAAPILFGVSDWIVSRVTPSDGKYSWDQSMGIAEREQPSNNVAYTLMAAQLVLRAAIATAERTGTQVPDRWRRVLNGLCLPLNSRTGVVMSHDDYRPNEKKGATPGPLAALFPLDYELDAQTEQTTLDFYLGMADEYNGSPMLSPLYGVWAARTGNRALALKLLDEGYGQMIGERFTQPLEMSPEKFPDKPRSGPFFANMGGFLASLIFGFPRIEPGPAKVDRWATKKVVLPQGWRSIRIERAWLRGAPATIEATHGAPRATITFD